MPIIGFTDLQRQSLQIGELRIGTSKAVPGKKGRQPVRLDTYRVTCGSRATAEGVAEIYGGQVEPWAERKGMWEVITDRTELQVWVPPRGEAVDSWMEAWDGPRCLAKCDGITMTRPQRGPCMCPHPADPADPASVDQARAERMRLAALRPPQACRPITRYKVSITELPGALGVFKLVTASEAAAVESADSGDLLALARERGIYLPAIARISWRTRVGDGKPYPVPTLQIGASLRQIASGELPAGPAGLMAALAPAAERRALTAGSEDGAPASLAALPAATPEPTVTPEPAVTDDDYLEPWQRATAIANRARATKTPNEFRACAAEAEAAGLMDESACLDRAKDEWQDLRSVLDSIWADKTRGAA